MTTREEITKDAKVGRYDEYDKGEVIDEIEQDFHNDQSDMALVNDHIENMVDTTTKYFEGDTFEEPTEEDLIQSAVKYDQNKPNRPYQSESCKPIFTAGKISIGLSHAKLFGLLDENGNICVKPQGMSVQEKMKTIKKAKELAQPKENPVVVMLPEDEDPSLKIRREERQKRLQAMKNPRLGYDFLGKDRGNILERVTAPAKSKKADKFAELDYDAKLDKLACPKCKREQSYDEYSEKKRVCGQCGIRFAQLHISNILAFEGRLKVKIQKAQQRKDAVEAEMYPTPKLNLTSLTSSVSRPTSPWSTGRASIGSSRAFDSGEWESCLGTGHYSRERERVRVCMCVPVYEKSVFERERKRDCLFNYL